MCRVFLWTNYDVYAQQQRREGRSFRSLFLSGGRVGLRESLPFPLISALKRL
jgi:hypothetical protein